MKMTIYEIGANLLKISNSSKTKANQFFEETEKIPYQHGLGIHDENFLTETISEIGQVHRELSAPGKLVIILPNFITTSRTINLPVSGKSKINMMIPFQLDESLPSGSQAMHWVEHVYKIDKNSSNICLSLINKDLFNEVHQQLKSIDLYPSLITSELSIYIHLIDVFKKPKIQNAPISASQANGNFVILDMGELQTKAYFFSDGQLVFNHYSNIGSQNIDENIADNYELSLHEAKVFKEESGFLFSEEDYNHADKDQVIFAKLMEKTLEPMLLDFAKWDLAFRSKTSNELEKCFIVGGMSKMNNIDNFLTEQLEIDTDSLEINNFSDSKEYTEYFTHQALNYIDDKSSKPGNFLKDEFKLSSGSSGLTENTAFFTNRTFVLSMIIIAFLFIERVFLEIDQENANKKFKKALSSKSLNLGKRDQVSYRKKHNKLKRLIKPRLEKIDDNSKILGQDLKIPLKMLSEHIKEINLVKGLKISKLSLYEKSISSELDVNNTNNIDDTVSDLNTKFGSNVKDLGDNKFEIFIRK